MDLEEMAILRKGEFPSCCFYCTGKTFAGLGVFDVKR